MRLLLAIVLLMVTAGLNVTENTSNATFKPFVNLSSNLVFPNQTLTICANFKPSHALIQNPAGKFFKLKFTRSGELYVSKLKFEKDVVLGEYTVMVDGIVKHFVVDFYLINATFNGSFVVGNVKYYYLPPKTLNYTIDDLQGFVELNKGRFEIPIPIGNHTITLQCGNAKVVLKVERRGEIHVRDFYFLNDTVFINSTFRPLRAYVVTPSNERINLNFEKVKNVYSAKFIANEIGVYRVYADGLVENFTVDDYVISAKVVNSTVMGTVKWHYLKPKTLIYIFEPSNVKGRVNVVNGRFKVPIPKNATKVVLKCGNAVLTLPISKLNIDVVREDLGYLEFKTLLNGREVKANVSATLNGRILKVRLFNGSYVLNYKPENGLLKVTAEYDGFKARLKRVINLKINSHIELKGFRIFVYGNVTFNGRPVNAKVEAKLGKVIEVSHGEFNFTFNASSGKILKIEASYRNLTVLRVYRINSSPVNFDVKVGRIVWINGSSTIPCEYSIDRFKGVVKGKFNLSFNLLSGNYTIKFLCGNLSYTRNFSIKKDIYVKSLYFPNETVEVFANFKPSKAFIKNPVGELHNLKFKFEGNEYVSRFELKRRVILGNYTVTVDGIVRRFVVDCYNITARFNGSAVIGNVSWHFVPPKYVEYSIFPIKRKGKVKVTNKNFVIPLNYLKSGVYTIQLSCGNAKTYLRVEINKRSKINKIIAYDPVEKAIIIKYQIIKYEDIEYSIENLTKILNKNKIFNFCSIKKKVKKIGGCKLLELEIPATKDAIRMFGFPLNITNTKIKVKKLSENKLRVELNNKLNVWYRFKVKLPKGYGVKKIVGDDGRVIKNTIKLNRITGEIEEEIRWYVENGTLYFYDDPIWGYNITLIPPQPNKSIAVELAYDGPYAGPGQISAIVFPYNSTDNSTTIASHDHAGRTEDNWANDIDIDAGSKIAIRFDMNGISHQYGNWYYYINRLLFWTFPMYSTLGGDGNFTLINRTYVNVNTAPNGMLESVIIDSFTTSGGEVNVTQKTIIRGDEKWFVTIYYIRPVFENLTNVRFFQGMDWNFNGDYRNDNCYYNSTFDIVYGHSNDTTLGEIEYGGYSSYLPSSAHDVGYFTDVYDFGSLSVPGVWGNISRNSLSNNSAYEGDAATVLAWDRATLNKSEVWVIPVVWGLGYNFSDLVQEIQRGKSMLYDVGVKSIDYPENNSNFNPNILKKIYINATVALYGLVDEQNLKVTVNVTRLDGGYTYENYTFVNLSVPFNETAKVSFPINISAMPYGTYKVIVKTNLPNDQNTTNDERWIIIRISSFTVEPDQTKIGFSGDEVLYNLTVYNYYSDGRFDINITQSTKGWTTRIYVNKTIVAEDSNGDGLWDYVNSSYDINGNGLPDLLIPYGVSNLTVSKVIPLNTPLGEIDYTTLDLSNTLNSAIHDDVTLTTETPQPPTVQKTFYLHEVSLNTTQPNSESPTLIQPNSLYSWQQIPPFADDFNVVGTIKISLWLNSSSTSTHDVTVSLIYTNGITSYTLGSQTKTVSLSSTPELVIFNITLTSQTSIPKGNYLIMRLENTQTTDNIYVFHNGTYLSNITLNTTTYVKVERILTNKTEYFVNETALILANITDPIGSYDICEANITIYYPNGTLYIKDDNMNLNATDPNEPSFWKLYDYNLPLPVPGIYNVTICGVESNGVSYCSQLNLTVMSFKSVSVGITAYQLNDDLSVTISVKAYRDMYNVRVYWIKPENFTVLSISGDYDSNGTYNNVYWWNFSELREGDLKQIRMNVTIDGDAKISDVYSIGVDPEVIK